MPTRLCGEWAGWWKYEGFGEGQIGYRLTGRNHSIIEYLDGAVSVGGGAMSMGDGAVSVGDGAVSVGDGAVSVGDGAVSMGEPHVGDGAVSMEMEDSASSVGEGGAIGAISGTRRELCRLRRLSSWKRFKKGFETSASLPATSGCALLMWSRNRSLFLGVHSKAPQ